MTKSIFGVAIALTAGALTCLPIHPRSASACGGPFDVACNVGKAVEKGAHDAGKAIEKGAHDTGKAAEVAMEQARQVGRDIDRMRLELQASVFTGPALEQWFKASRDSAINGAMVMPPEMRQALQGWYTPALMDKVRFKVGDGGALNLANNSIRVGHATAVTLIDVIIFKGPTEAADPTLWAHEMKHVQQFDEWGVHSFAVQYMRSWNSVEDPAYYMERLYAQKMAQQ
jgi:hypothetical protein